MTTELTVIDLADVAADAGGAIWSLPHGGDLDANLVRLHPRQAIDDHVNDEVDVLISLRSGSGEVVVDGVAHPLTPDTLVLVPRGASRRLTAGDSGISYLTVHRGRGPLTIGGSTD